MNKTEKMVFREAAQICEQKDFGIVPLGSELKGTYAYSEDLGAQINKLADGLERKRVKKRIARVIILAAVLIALTGLTAFGATALREAGLLVLTNIYSSPDKDPWASGRPAEELTQGWLPGYIPEGFEPVVTISEYNTIEMVWARADGAQLHLIQQRNMNIMYDMNDAGRPECVFESVQIHDDRTYYISKYQSMYMVNWSIGEPDAPDHADCLLFGNVGADEAMKVALSLVPAEKRYGSVTVQAEQGEGIIEGPSSLEDYYCPEYIPEGFKMTEEDGFPRRLIYTDSDGREIFFSQATVYSTNTVDTEHHEYSVRLEDGIKYHCFAGTGGVYDSNMIIWVQNGYMFSISDRNGVGLDESLKIAKSLRYDRPNDAGSDSKRHGSR